MSENAFIQEVAASEVRLLADMRKALLEEHSSAAKWLMASLLTLNAGGLVFLGRHFVGSPNQVVAGAGFYVGIVTALLIGWLGQRANRACLDPLRALEVFWMEVGSTGKFDEVRLNGLSEKLKVAGRNKATHSGWLSLIAFSLGLIGLMSPHLDLHWSNFSDDATADNIEMPADQAIPSNDQ